MKILKTIFEYVKIFFTAFFKGAASSIASGNNSGYSYSKRERKPIDCYKKEVDYQYFYGQKGRYNQPRF